MLFRSTSSGTNNFNIINEGRSVGTAFTNLSSLLNEQSEKMTANTNSAGFVTTTTTTTKLLSSGVNSGPNTASEGTDESKLDKIDPNCQVR